LEQIKSYFGVGKIYKQGKNNLQYRVISLEDLTNVIIPHFENIHLITQKRADFELFKQVVDLMNQKEHLTPEGLQKIIAIKGSINLGLPEKLKDSFPNIIPVFRYVVENKKKIIDPY